MIYNNILEAMGHTPMIRLQHMVGPDSAEILVKFEGLNVGGSIKTRTAYNMILAAEKEGRITKDTIIVEPTSGNQGIGLALVGAVRGYKTVIIMPDSVSEERRKLVHHYGAEVILIHDAGDIGACIAECLNTALRMAEEDPNVFVPEQFSNPNNPLVHKYHTGVEILEQVAGPIDGFCSGIGTGGTISGIGEVLKTQNPDITIWAVEPESAAILSGGSIGTHLQMGIGDGLIPDNLNQNIYSDIYIVTDEVARYWAEPAMADLAAQLAERAAAGDKSSLPTLFPDRYRERSMHRSLAEMRPTLPRTPENWRRVLGELAAVSAVLTKE